MVLKIKTFVNQKPCTFFKALGHPFIRARFESLKTKKFSAIYDPEGHLDDFLAMTKVPPPSYIYVQAIEALNAQSSIISQIQHDKIEKLFILSFDPQKHLTQMGHLLSPSCEVSSLKELRLPDVMLTDPSNYLSDLNFSTNFAFFREEEGWHTRLKSANCWTKYDAKNVKLWAILFDQNGKTLAQWEESVPATVHSIVIDSRDIKKRFNLPDFTGQLFVHFTHTKGHSIVKYALDTFHDDGQISATHDANAWPPEYFSGLPAPREGEKVILWLQNSHPTSVSANGVSLNLMGDANHHILDRDIPPFGTYALDVEDLLPKARWPQQIELHAGHYFVRPRYEVVNKKGYRCMAHVNVERMDLKPDLRLREIRDMLGKGFILPAPLFPTDLYTTSLLPTPMSRELHFMPIKALVYTKEGTLKGSFDFGNLPRHQITSLVVNDIIQLNQDYGHVELVYDFAAGTEADGWLHAIFRYEHKTLPAQAETSFGSHLFNTVITYKNEPQSYKGSPPGLTTGLFLRVDDDIETFCHLIYPTSTPWHKTSDTKLILHTKEGTAIAEANLKIPQSGSRMWIYQDTFTLADREKARSGYVMIQDNTCRLFGYHGLRQKNGSFSLDHMFGF
ncbi:MAG: hypothetical protein KA112_03290 [Alphaproteobacteria bacterium]|jgi:hypothetical protein|nr:hypothetical protein [Alphaproteobacteria bacterium]MBP7729622.1 hypothetical protein [Alphaproteobacteria bacterium]